MPPQSTYLIPQYDLSTALPTQGHPTMDFLATISENLDEGKQRRVMIEKLRISEW